VFGRTIIAPEAPANSVQEPVQSTDLMIRKTNNLRKDAATYLRFGAGLFLSR